MLGVQTAFNNARAAENAQLGTSIPTNLVMPPQSAWDSLSYAEQALFLFNAERVARGLLPFQGTDTNLIAVAQAYADTMASLQMLSHSANGTTYQSRVDANPALSGKYQWISELLAESMPASSKFIPTAVYLYLYQDSVISWIHRNIVLYNALQNDYGSAGSEGLIGVGGANSASASYFDFVFFDPAGNYLTAVLPESMPTRTELGQNFPNPFNPATTIRYALSSRAHVTLTVYNLLGETVAELVNADRPAGAYEVRFDASHLASGVYFYRLLAGDYAEMRRLVVVK